jgi:hypothetical protein
MEFFCNKNRVVRQLTTLRGSQVDHLVPAKPELADRIVIRILEPEERDVHLFDFRVQPRENLFEIPIQGTSAVFWISNGGKKRAIFTSHDEARLPRLHIPERPFLVPNNSTVPDHDRTCRKRGKWLDSNTCCIHQTSFTS